MRGRVLPDVLGRSRAAVLEVDQELGVAVVTLQLHELEISGPRTDFDKEAVRAEPDANGGPCLCGLLALV